MSVKHPLLLYWLLLLPIVLTTGCWRTPEPSPEHPLLMGAMASYEDDKVSVEAIESVFMGSTGPQQVPFDKTEWWIAEGNASGLKLFQTTEQKRIELTHLLPDKEYYIAVRGSKGTYWSELSRPIRVIADPVKPTKLLLQRTTNAFGFYLAPNAVYTLEQGTDTREVVIGNILTVQSEKLNYNGVAFMFKDWIANGERILFEVPGQRRGYVTYDISKKNFTEFALPETARVWLAAISPDGKKIAYTDYNRTGSVWLYDTDTKVDKRTSLPMPYDLNWTPDSRQLLVHRYGDTSLDTQEIVLYDVQGDAVVKKLFTSPVKGYVQWPKLSPSGRELLFSSSLSGQPHLWHYDLTTEKLRPVTKSTHQFGWLSASSFYAVEEGPTPKVWLYR